MKLNQYKSILRSEHPNWIGWQILDEIKSKEELKEKQQLLDDLEYSYKKKIEND